MALGTRVLILSASTHTGIAMPSWFSGKQWILVHPSSYSTEDNILVFSERLRVTTGHTKCDSANIPDSAVFSMTVVWVMFWIAFWYSPHCPYTNNSLEIIEQIRDAQTHRRKLSHSHQSQCLCLEFADKILIFAILKRWLLQQRETDFSFFCGSIYSPTSGSWTQLNRIN